MTASNDKFSRWEYQNIALACVAQSATLVQRLAAQGQVPQQELIAAVNPLFVLDPESTAEVYPRVGDLSMGLRAMQAIFGNERNAENTALVRYTLGMLLLRNRLAANPTMQASIRERLGRMQPLEVLASGLNDDDLRRTESLQDQKFRQLAALYQDTISTLNYRVQVQGKVDYLQDENIANRIRALLLAGIRSAVLWYQLGGRRWRLLLHRKKIQESAGDIRRKLLISV